MKKLLSILVCVLLGVGPVFADKTEPKGSVTITAVAATRNEKQVGDVQVKTATAINATTISAVFSSWTWGSWVSGTAGSTSTSTSNPALHSWTWTRPIFGGTKTSTEETGPKFQLIAYPYNGYYFETWNQGTYLYKTGRTGYDYTKNNPTPEGLTTAYLESGEKTYGPYTATFAPLTVNSVASNTAKIQTNDLYGEGSAIVTFTVHDKTTDIEDYTWTYDLPEGYSIEDPVEVTEDNKVVFTVNFQDQDKHGDYSEFVITLTSKAAKNETFENSSKAITVSANSDLTPVFSMPEWYNFQRLDENEHRIPINTTIASDQSLFATDKNKVALALNSTWTAEITGDDASAFKVVDTAEGKYVVNFTPTEERTYSAILKTTVTYTDKEGETIRSEKTTTLAGEGVRTAQSIIAFNPVEWHIGQQVTGFEAAEPFAVNMENVANVVYSFGDNLPNGFPFAYDASEAGRVKILVNATAPGTYEATLIATGDNTMDGHSGEKTTATLPMSITVGLQSPILNGGSNETDYILTWTHVPHANDYTIYEVNGDTETDVTEDVHYVVQDGPIRSVTISAGESTSKTFKIKATGQFEGNTYTSYSNPETITKGTLLYHYTGPSVYVSELEPEGGFVYVDRGEAGDVANVEEWSRALEDHSFYTQKDNNICAYTYYAKVSDPTKYAFKGWTFAPQGEATNGTSPLRYVYSHSFEMDDVENTRADNSYITPSLYAVFESFYYMAPPAAVATLSKGSGAVAVSLISVESPNYSDEIVAGSLQQVAAKGSQHDYKVYYYAQARPGAQFVGWSTTADGANIINQDPTYVANYKTEVKNREFAHVAAPLYAVFRSDIDIRQQDRMILYIDEEEGEANINDAKVLIDFQKANTLTATLSGNDMALFTLSNRSGSKSGTTITFDAKQGLIEMVVKYTGDLGIAKNKKAEITLSATYGGQTITRSITIVVEEAPVITFLPTDAKGDYTIKITNGSGVNYKMDATATEDIKVQITHESMSNFELAISQDKADDDFYFFGWQMIDGNNVTYLSYEQLCTYQFTKSVSVKAEFIPNNQATYFIKNDPNEVVYSDLQKALDDARALYAKNSQMQIVVLNDYKGNTNTRVKEVLLPKGNYTIHKGVTLLVPGDAEYTSKSQLDLTDYIADKPTTAIHNSDTYIKLMVEDGTTISVSGMLSVYAQLQINNQTWLGRPYRYGWIDLGEDCVITLNSGAELYAYGYITGPTSSHIHAKSKTVVKEAFQILDWHGGNETLEYMGGLIAAGLSGGEPTKEKVFPCSQYYVQSVEVPLTLEYGAKEYLSAGVNMGSMGLFIVEAPFVGANEGFFRLVDGVSLTKHYDKHTDSQVYTVKGNGSATAKLGEIVLPVNVLSIKSINSGKFVLPIPHNMDIYLNDVTVEALYDLAFLAGSKLYINKTSTFSVQSGNLFIYDQSQNGPWFGTGNKEIIPVGYRPGANYTTVNNKITPINNMLYTRKPADLQDATFIIDGKVVCGSNGYVYTTQNSYNGTSDNQHAKITSNGGGQFTFAKLGEQTATYQRKMGEFVTVPIVPARLLNEDATNGQYTIPSEANQTFTYKSGKWSLGQDGEEPNMPVASDYAPKFTAEGKTFTAFVGKSESTEIAITTDNNSSALWNDVAWTYSISGTNADQFSFAGTLPNGNITFTPTSEGVKTATLKVTATYNRTVSDQIVPYVYSKDIHLTGNASYLNTNTLAFADLSTVFVGQGAIALFTGGNNSQPITITTSPAGIVTTSGNTSTATLTANNVGEVTITATQLDDHTNNIAGTTITKRVKVTEAVEWNWSDLYFGSVNSNPVTIHNGATSWTLREKRDDLNIIDLQGESPDYTLSIDNYMAGNYEAIFTYSDNKDVTKDFTSKVYADPRYLRVDVNSDVVYRAVTLSANTQVKFDAATEAVQFQSTEQNISQWKMTFIGVPDKINFIPNGENTWQIEESTNGTNWTTSFSWKYLTAGKPFEMSLLPSTRYVRISYGAGNTNVASLKSLYVTKLEDVKADVNKIYMPIDGKNNAEKEIVLTYANTGRLDIRTNDADKFKIKFSDSNLDPNDVLSIPATTEDNPFGIKGVEVVCYATAATTGELQVYSGSQLVLQIPIHAYKFPQDLPIKLATDEPIGGDRYYYVTTHSHNVEWDGTDGVRTITMHNAVSDAAPYVTFAFNGNPTFISFDYTPAAKGTWVIEQSTDGINWNIASHNSDNDDVMTGGKLKRSVNTSSKYIRVIYESAYAEKIEIQNLTIVGGASVVVNPTKLQLDYNVAQQLTLTAINLTAIDIATSSSNFTITPTTTNAYAQTLQLTSKTNPDQLGENKMGDIVLDVKWSGSSMVEYGKITITNPNDYDNVLATVELVGIKNSITDGTLNIKTGVPSEYTLNGTFEGSSHRDVNISAAFSATDNKPLFDYVVIYGETTTNDGQKTITTPNKNAGSNAKTPYYIYKKSNDGNSYVLNTLVENANSSRKAWSQEVNDIVDDAVMIENGNAVSMYITGFCPYATTGYTKEDEGVWYFRANAGQSIDVYLEDCYIYSRAKTFDGHTFADRQDGNSFGGDYVLGSGAVLVFACNDKENQSNPMNVTIHTLGGNLLKSNYGCFYQTPAGRAFQVSSPVQIRLINNDYWLSTKTILNFTDEWPASKNGKTGDKVRTNGFISLQKQVNNAPSIDMGAPNTVVNFDGGQVELQNAQIVSQNYASSLAICPRSGEFAGVRLAYGMATDATSGTVNFNDGTTTVKPMWVSPTYFESYLCDKDVNGNYIRNEKGEYLTTCLRTPANTFVTGGSHCMMRACPNPKSQGGAPKDKPGEDGNLLGLYKYPSVGVVDETTGKVTTKGGWSVNGTNGLVTPTYVPEGYNVNSVTPNNNGTVVSDECNLECATADDYLNFWFDPTFEPSAQPEINKEISFWKTCMTRIEAEYPGVPLRSVGGDTEVRFENGEQTEVVKNLLYCQLDDNIRVIIGADDYQAPVKNPAPAGENYIPIHPTTVGEELQHYITNGESYQVEDRIYYITTATADVWMMFTAPFDVEKIYVVETYPESQLEQTPIKQGATGQLSKRGSVMLEQAKHNADFASFFAVTIALGQDKDFNTIYNEWLDWAKMKDKESGFYTTGKYDIRGMWPLEPYWATDLDEDGIEESNWATANFYLNHNNGYWEEKGDGYGDDSDFITKWERFTPSPNPKQGDPLLLKGETYSMLFPYCVGCEGKKDSPDRGYWDYWSGKFLIFESTMKTKDKNNNVVPHTIYGADYVDKNKDGNIFNGFKEGKDAALLGNPTFAMMNSEDKNIYTYIPSLPGKNDGNFYAVDSDEDGYINIEIAPTNSFLLTKVEAPAGYKIRSISYAGKINYEATSDDNNGGDDLGTDTHVPTINGGSDIFVTSTADGINIAVAEPQYVGVFAANGTLLFNGWVENSVNVALMNKGVYVVVGENVSVKVIY